MLDGIEWETDPIFPSSSSASIGTNPFLLGFQASINLETNQRVNTEIIGEYSRRTHGLVVRYSPTQSIGSIGFRLSDFNWLGSGSPFDDGDIRQVEGSVVEQR